jgi:hypothetical protein
MTIEEISRMFLHFLRIVLLFCRQYLPEVFSRLQWLILSLKETDSQSKHFFPAFFAIIADAFFL